MSTRSRRRPPGRARAQADGRRNRRSDLSARIAAAVPLIALAIALVAVGGAVFAAGLFVLGVICLRELFSMFPRARPVVLGGFVALAGLVAAAQAGDASSVLLLLVASIPLIFLFSFLQPGGAGLAGITVTLLGVSWVGLGLAHAVLLRDLPHGGGIVVLVLVATFLGDTGAYLGGRLLGSRRLAPSISPNKTVEGLLIGIAVGTFGGWFVGLYHDWLSGPDALLIGAIAALAAPIGDLFESFVKREAAMKDSGTIFGAHGGALDRLDAAIFSLVAGYYVWQALL